MAEVFAFPPSDFEMKPWRLSWESPCWVTASIILRPLTAAAREKFFPNLSMPHKVDAFARLKWEDQLWNAFSPRIDHLCGRYANAWWPELMNCYEKLKEGLKKPETIFQEPLRFAGRRKFVTVNLPTILKENPEALSVYLAAEKGSYSDYMFLRIHSSLPFFGHKPRCLWFEKRLPDSLHSEDVLPWMVATIRRLPKMCQPPDIEPWTKRLLHFEPDLSQHITGEDKPWLKKPDLVFVLGPTSKIGYRSLTHFERRDISHIVRQDDILTIEGKERYGWRDGTMEIDRTFYLIAFDGAAAERVERRILSGERVHFGLDADVLGMICRSGHVIHSMNVPVETVRRLCVEPGLDLRPLGRPRDKLKTYELCKPGESVYISGDS